MKLLVVSTLVGAATAAQCCLPGGVGCVDAADSCGDAETCCNTNGVPSTGNFICCAGRCVVTDPITNVQGCEDKSEYQVTWDYSKSGDMGPKKWKDTYPGCGKKMQSPINLKTGSAKSTKNSELPKLKVRPTPRSDDMTTWSVHNAGHRLELTPDKAAANWQDYKLTGGIMDNTYDLHSAVVHWKAEHEVNGNRQDAELQIMWHSDEDQAENQPWTVFGIMINEGSKEKDLDPLYDAAKLVQAYDAKTTMDLSLKRMLPKDYDEDYYYYRGSMTQPPCTEGIFWVLPRYMLKSSDDQIDDLKDMMDKNGDKMKNIYRNEQKLNARTVFKSFKPSSGSASFFG